MLPWIQPLVLPGVLIFSVWLAYWGIWNGSWVSDDIAGISVYDGKLQRPLSWHNIFKLIRYHVGKTPTSNKKWKEEKQSPFQQSPAAHHRFNLYVTSGLIVLLYSFLMRVTSPTIAFASSLLFAVHPLGCQTIGWISGIGYCLGTFWMLAGLNVACSLYDTGWLQTPLGFLASLGIYGMFQWMAVEAWFGSVGAVLILLWLGYYPLALLATILACWQCFHTFRDALTLRRTTFKEQQMGASTRFHPGKWPVVMKTLYYDMKLAIFPKRMGLYHTFCYHYELPHTEYEDRYCWAGVGVLLGLGACLVWGSPTVQLGALWFLAFVGLFLNWITANQFVVDRYVWLPAFGLCLIAATLLPEWAYWILVGVALMRLWAHHYTYQDEFFFYHSNLINFPTSEVAWGNLGVAYLQRGMVGSAFDAWMEGIRRNAEYDVCWYNISELLRSRGPLNPNYAPVFYQQFPSAQLQELFEKDGPRSHLQLARFCLQRAVNAKTCHFPVVWKKQLAELEFELSRPVGQRIQVSPLVRPLLTSAVT